MKQCKNESCKTTETSRWYGDLCRSCYDKQFRIFNKEKIRAREKKHEQTPEKRNYDKLYKEANREIIKKQKRSHYINNKELYKKYRESHKEERRQYYLNVTRLKRQTNKEDYNKKAREYAKKRYYSDTLYKITILYRVRLRHALKGNLRTFRSLTYLGCSIEEFKKYIEKQFLPGMSWDNNTLHGWHLDHIKPLWQFDLTKEEDRIIALHYTNLRPLWSSENWSRPKAN